MISQKTILIIDDENQICNSLKYFFEDEGYNVFTALDGVQGISIFLSEKVDIVITDLRMPKKDGLEVMQAIHQYNPETPMIVISGVGNEDDIINALRMGAKDYIKKPIQDMNRIGSVVKHILENQRLIEENRQYRKKLEKSEQQHRTITENIAEGVFTVDEYENLTYANQAFCKMVGYTNDEILKKNLKNISTENNFKIILEQTLERKKGLIGRYKIEIFDKGMHPVHVELACSPVCNGENRYCGAIAVVRDITKFVELKKKYKNFIGQNKKIANNVIPVCANCKSIRVQKGDWIPMEEYFKEINFSHGICPECCESLYPEFDL
jgi:PAS domain S-box-containing protein